MSIFDDTLHFEQFKPKPSTWNVKNKHSHYSSDFICFDSETSWNHCSENKYEKARGWVYQWCFYYQEKYIYGRHIEDYVHCLEKIKKFYTNEKQKTIVFVHNLSFDLQYMKDFLIEKFGKDFTMLALSNHKFITFTISGFEFRCTYRLSNRSLEKWAKDIQTKHRKLSGTIDYNKIRYPNTKLVKKDWKYMIYDVVVLKECIEKELLLENDSICSMPLTSTGYVRRDARKIFKENYKNNRELFLKSRLDYKTYTICKNAFAGGLTHANRFIVNETIEGNIKHYDFRSHYPSQQRCKKFPIGKWNKINDYTNFETIEKYTKDNCVILNITFLNIVLKDRQETLPYLSESKVRQGKINQLKIIADNGRVLRVQGIFTLCLTELDLEIIRKQYTYDSYVINVAYASQKGFLPKWMYELVDMYYFEKSHFKEKTIKDNEDIESAISLLKSKNKLNGIYGMTATDIIRTSFKMDENGNWKSEKPTSKEDIESSLCDYYKNKNNFMSYAWGVYCTAHARHELMEFYYLIGKENFLYGDTDSIFFISSDKILDKIKAKNECFLLQAKNRKEYIETAKKTYFYHSFDDENEIITKFRTLHSKCYAYVEKTEDGEKLKTVIAGVQSIAEGTTRENELGNIDNLQPGFTFVKTGGKRAIYIEQNENTNSCMLLVDTTKTLNNIVDEQDSLYEKEEI